MAYFEVERETVVARILYDGLGTAGKTRSLQKIRTIFSERSGDIFVPEEANGRTLYFDWLELQAGRFGEHPLRVELMTVPGQWAYAHRRWMLLRSPDAIIAVVDSTPQGLVRATYAMRFLEKRLSEMGAAAPPLVVQAHKQDLPDAAPVDEVRARLGLSERVPIVGTSAETGEGLRYAFVLALRDAREHVRRALGDKPARTLPPAAADAEALYVEMQDAERTGADLEGELLVDAVLNEMDGGG